MMGTSEKKETPINRRQAAQRERREREKQEKGREAAKRRQRDRAKREEKLRQQNDPDPGMCSVENRNAVIRIMMSCFTCFCCLLTVDAIVLLALHSRPRERETGSEKTGRAA